MKSYIAVAVIAALLSQGSCFFSASKVVGGGLNMAGSALQTGANLVSGSSTARPATAPVANTPQPSQQTTPPRVSTTTPLPATTAPPAPAAAAPSSNQASQQIMGAIQQNVASFLSGFVNKAKENVGSAQQISASLNPSKITDGAKDAVNNAKEAVDKAQAAADKIVGDAQNTAKKVVGQANAAAQEVLAGLPARINGFISSADGITKTAMEMINTLRQGQTMQYINAAQKMISSARQVMDSLVGNYGTTIHNVIGQVTGRVQNILQQASQLVDDIQSNFPKGQQTRQ